MRKRITIKGILALSSIVCLFGVMALPLLAQEKVVLRVADGLAFPSTKAALDEIFAKFEKEYPNIGIKHESTDDITYENTIRTAFLAGENLADVYQGEFQYARQLVSGGYVLDVTEWWEKVGKYRLVPGAESIFQVPEEPGRVFGFPYFVKNYDTFYYNVDILAKYGIAPPATYDQFLAACETLKKNGEIPMVLSGKDAWCVDLLAQTILVNSAGADFSLKVKFFQEPWANPVFIEALSQFNELAQKGYFQPGLFSDGYTASLAFWTSGHGAFYHTASWLIGEIEAPPTFHWDVIEFPALPREVEKGHVARVTFAEGWFANAETEHPDEVLKLFEFMLRAEAAKTWAAIGRICPVKGSMAEVPEKAKKAQAIVDAATETLSFVGSETIPRDIFSKYRADLVSMLYGDMTPEEVLRTLDNRIKVAGVEVGY